MAYCGVRSARLWFCSDIGLWAINLKDDDEDITNISASFANVLRLISPHFTMMDQYDVE
jgi:hypothetical protein